MVADFDDGVAIIGSQGAAERSHIGRVLTIGTDQPHRRHHLQMAIRELRHKHRIYLWQMLWCHPDAQLRAVARAEWALGQRLPIAILGNLCLWRLVAGISELAGDRAVDTEPAHP